MFGSKTKDQSRVYAAPPPAEDGGNVEMGDMRKRAGSVSSEAPPVSADDEIALAYLSRYDTMSTSEYISETIMSMRDDFGGVETLDLHSAAFLGVPLVLAYYSVFLICLVYFTVVGVNSLTASKYLSLQGTNADQNCKEKPQTVTGFYLADYNGMWETFPGFEDNASLFTIKFTGSSLSDKQFTDVMASFQTKLAEYGAKAASRSVFYNALVWSTFSFYDDRFKIEFTSNVDAGTIAYNQFMNGAAWSSAYGICNVSYPSNIVGSYDQATKSYRMDIPLNLPRTYETDFNTHKTYKVPEPCPLQGKMSMFTSEVIRDASYYSPARFSLKFDARTIFAVIAMNLGIVDASKFTQTNSVYQPYVANKWPGTFYVDRLYVPMPAFFCIDKGAAVYGLNADQQNGPEICFYVYEGNGPYGSAFLYPVGYHLKPENDYNGKPDNGNWIRCKCPQDKFARGCNRQDFYFMLFHRNNASTANNEKKMIQFGIKAQSFLVADPINGDKSAADYYSRVVALTNMISKEQLNPEKKFTSHIINRHLNSYTYGGASYYGDFMNFSYTRGMTWHEELTYEWRKICPDSGCSGIFFNSLAGPKMNNFQSVNSYNVQFGLLSNQTFYSPVLHGPVPLQMCVDTLSQSLVMSRLGAKPPVSLVQSYFECSNTVSKALTTAIGSAAGSANLYTGIVMSVLGVVVVYVLNTFAARKVHANKYVKAVYTPLEKEIIILERERRMKVRCSGVATLWGCVWSRLVGPSTEPFLPRAGRP
jgi:hypothetical protein